MAKILYNKTGYEKIFDNAFENYIYLAPHLYKKQMIPIIQWCKKNLNDTIFMGFSDVNDLQNMKTYLYAVDNNYTYPVFRFVDITDMMAFKLRWSEFIQSRLDNRIQNIESSDRLKEV